MKTWTMWRCPTCEWEGCLYTSSKHDNDFRALSCHGCRGSAVPVASPLINVPMVCTHHEVADECYTCNDLADLMISLTAKG